MDSDSSEWRCVDGRVDVAAEHFEIRYGDEGALIARVSRGPASTFIVDFEPLGGIADDDQNILNAVRSEIDFYLVELGEPDPWAYAIYHCNTMANVYSRVHWAHVPESIRRS